MSWFTEMEERFRRGSHGDQQTAPAPGKQTLLATDHAPAAIHVLPPPSPTEAAEVSNARALLSRTDLDAGRQLEIIRRVLELADHSPPRTAEQLLRLLVPFGREYPAITSVVANRLAALRPETNGHGTRVYLDPGQEAAAAAFNAKHPANVAAFIAATHMFATPADVDVQAVARWQASNHLVVDGQIGSGTLSAAKAPAGSTSASTTAGTSSPAATGGTTASGASHSGGGGHTQSMAGDIPGLEQKQAALLAKMRQEDEGKEGHLKAEDVKFTRADIARGFYALGPPPAYSNAFRRLMVGHAVGEQGGVAPNRNFYGEECCWSGIEKYPAKGRSWARIKRSDTITEAMYWREPARFYDWGTTIKAQLEGKAERPNGDPTLLYVMWYSPRPAFETWDEATRGFWGNIVGWRLATFAKSKDPEVKAVATGALAGKIDAYLELVAHHDDAPGAKKIGIPPFNSDKDYKKNLRPHLETAVTDPTLADPTT